MKAIAEIIKREGGYVNHPGDKGGPTKYGITESTARQHGYNGSMIDLPIEMAERIYYEQYYIGTNISKITHPAVAEELLDSAVLHGPSTSIKWLQTALNAFNDSPALMVDGVLGYATRSAANSFLTHNQKRDGAVVLVRALNCLQGAYMISLGDYGKPFLFGWLAHRVSI